MRKFLIFLLVTILLCIFLVCVVLRFYPKAYVAAANYFLPENVVIDQLDIQFFPVNVSIGGLNVENSAGAPFLTLREADFSTDIVDWVQGKNNFWKARVDGLDLDLLNLPDSSGETNEENTSGGSVVNVHQILSLLNVDAGQINVKIDEQQSLVVNVLSTELNDENLTDFKKVEQGVRFSLDYLNSQDNQGPLRLEGELESRFENGVARVQLSIPELDVSSFLSLGDTQADGDLDGIDEAESNIESAIDWSWMSAIDPVNLALSLGRLTLTEKSSINDLVLSLSLDESIEFDTQLAVQWFDSAEFKFTDGVHLSGKWRPLSESTLGADISGDLSLQTSVLNLSVQGDVNVNGVDANAILLDFQTSTLPLDLALDKDVQLLIEQYFPISVNANVATQTDLIDLVINQSAFGQSDLAGSLSMPFGGSVNTIKAQLESSVLSYQGLEAVDGQEPEKQSDSDRVFDDQPIDWSWLDALALDFNLNAKQVLVDDIELTELKLPLIVANGDLSMTDFSVGLAEGVIDSNLKLSKKDDAADIKIDLSAKNVVLEKLNLLPPEELSGGNADLVLNLTTNGSSSQELASALNGAVKLEVGDGVIGNDSFELIGSDLILSLLNKLNPFAKSDKTTNLECAIVNLKVESGKIDIDKSLALKTSKLTMVADGYVDLNSEKIKLGLTPKTRKGVGVDVSSLVKFIALGGTLLEPAPTVTASGVLKSALVVGAAVSTGGVSLLATSAAEKALGSVDVCERARKAYE